MKQSFPDPHDTNSPRTVLHLICGIDPRGGLPSYVRQITDQKVVGYEQLVWRHRDYQAENGSYVCRGWARKTDVNVVMDVLGALMDFLPLYFWLRKHPSVLLHAHTRMGTVLAALVRVTRPIPVVAHVHARWRRKGFHLWLWQLARAKVVFNSKGTYLHFDRTPPNAEILMPTFPWLDAPQAGEGRCISSSLIVPHKNAHLIIEAYNRATPFPNSTLHIYGFSAALGDPVYEKQIVAMAKQYPSIHLHDWNPRWTEGLGCKDVFIHASKLESFGIVLLEAFAKGCRIVAPHGTFLEDLPGAGIFPADLTVEDLAKKIELAQAYQPPKNFWEMRRNVAPLFSIENTMKRLSSIYAAAAAANQ